MCRNEATDILSAYAEDVLCERMEKKKEIEMLLFPYVCESRER